MDIRAVACVVDHRLQDSSAEVARDAAASASHMGMDSRIVRVTVDEEHSDGLEAAAREARYAALEDLADELDSPAILLGHTLDDQAETVLLGLARGSGAASLAGMAPVSGRRVRPLLTVRRSTTHAACEADALAPWHDPHNEDPRFARVRVRTTVLPLLERELGPGIADALARTAEQLREDNDAFHEMIDETIEDIVEHVEAGIAISVAALSANPAAVRGRIIRYVVKSEFGVSLTRAQTREIARLAVDWRGQGPIDLPGFAAARQGGRIEMRARQAHASLSDL